MVKELMSPEFRILLDKYIIKEGIEVECFSSKQAKADWCKIELTTQLQDAVLYENMEKVTVELGYADDYDILLSGFARKGNNDSWKEILVKDEMIFLENTEIKATFKDCEPQDIVRYILTQAGITKYKLSEERYGTKKICVINKQNAIQALMELNNAYGINNDFFFQNGVFYWGCMTDQEYVYVLEENENILSLQKLGELWEIETLGVPWIHHSQEIEVQHSKYSGTVTVEKTIVRSDADGYTRMYIYFKGEK